MSNPTTTTATGFDEVALAKALAAYAEALAAGRTKAEAGDAAEAARLLHAGVVESEARHQAHEAAAAQAARNTAQRATLAAAYHDARNRYHFSRTPANEAALKAARQAVLAFDLRLALLGHAERNDAAPAFDLDAAGLADLNAAVALLADMARTMPAERRSTPAERRKAIRPASHSSKLRNLAALLAR